MRLICLDTNILTWGLKKQCTPGQEDNLEKAESLIERLFQLGDHIVIPTLVLSELLVTIPEEKHNEFLSDVCQDYLVAPFDTQAARKFGEIYPNWKRIKRANGSLTQDMTRQEIKTDYMIIATAISVGCECIYSEDSKFQKFAEESGIRCKNLPSSEKQLNLDRL